MKVLGFSINLLTLFGLVLATGLVVDDAIIVVENVTRFMVEQGRQARQAAREAMGEVVGPIIATSLVLMAVFVPAAFMLGVIGQLYKPFALTTACSVGISTFNALTLSPRPLRCVSACWAQPTEVVFSAVQPRFRLGRAGIWPHGQGADPGLDVCADRLRGAARHHLLHVPPGAHGLHSR
jgi:multidrug efflux pump subunit AcrB